MVSIFLSLSFADRDFVNSVYKRLPHGVARYYEKSFDRGEDLISAMEKSIDSSDIFVLFASRASLSSYAVHFEIEEAKRKIIFNNMYSLWNLILIFVSFLNGCIIIGYRTLEIRLQILLVI